MPAKPVSSRLSRQAPSQKCTYHRSLKATNFPSSMCVSESPPPEFNGLISCRVDGYHVQLALYDTSAQEDYDRLRPLSYIGAEVILLCFRANNPTAETKGRILQKWTPELSRFCPGVPIVLVGLNHPDDSDEEEMMSGREQQDDEPFVPFSIRKEIGSSKYFFCDPYSGFGVDELLEYVSNPPRCWTPRYCPGCSEGEG